MSKLVWGKKGSWDSKAHETEAGQGMTIRVRLVKFKRDFHAFKDETSAREPKISGGGGGGAGENDEKEEEEGLRRRRRRATDEEEEPRRSGRTRMRSRVKFSSSSVFTLFLLFFLR